MKNKEHIIDLIINNPNKSEFDIYNQASFERNDVEESLLAVEVIQNLKNYDIEFLKEVKRCIETL